MTLGWNQFLTEMNTKHNFWGVKDAGAYSGKHFYLDVPIFSIFGSLKLLETSEAVLGQHRDCFTFIFNYNN